jgi:hypothetical protein
MKSACDLSEAADAYMNMGNAFREKAMFKKPSKKCYQKSLALQPSSSVSAISAAT